ncbi:hypothetical protein BKI52_11120 [marine bacterium AO1-C]|nr:hypothetical protein BKI52_11120 [marine bacterium AO1-C]
MENDEYFIRKTYEIAQTSAEQGFDPFGAILVKNQQIVATSGDKCIQYADPTAHAELVLISEYCRAHELISLEGYTLYCNVEPCMMCSGAIHWARISRVVFGVSQQSLQSVSKGKTKPSAEEMINIGNKKIEVVGPVLAKEGLALLRQFPFKSKKDRYQEFKQKNK